MTNPVLVFVKIWENYSRICSFINGIVVKNVSASVGDVRDVGLIPGSGRSSGAGNGNALRYSCQENSMNRGAYSPWGHRAKHDSEWAHTLTYNMIFLNGLLYVNHFSLFFFKLEMEPLTKSSKVFISDFCSLLKEGLDWPFDHAARGKTTWKEKITCRHFGELSTQGNFICLLALMALWWRVTGRNVIAS